MAIDRFSPNLRQELAYLLFRPQGRLGPCKNCGRLKLIKQTTCHRCGASTFLHDMVEMEKMKGQAQLSVRQEQSESRKPARREHPEPASESPPPRPRRSSGSRRPPPEQEPTPSKGPEKRKKEPPKVDRDPLLPRSPAVAALPSGQTCPSCRSVNEPGSTFCDICGGPIGGAALAAPVPQVALPRILRVGREVDNDIVVDSEQVSRYHATVEMRGGQVILTDVGSSNGTSVNGNKISGPTMITPSDRVGFGSYDVPTALLWSRLR